MKLSISIFFMSLLMYLHLTAQVKDSSIKIKQDIIVKIIGTKNLYAAVLDSNNLLNIKGVPQSLSVNVKKQETSDYLFYAFAALFFLIGILRTIYSRYFTTMFRVFFNTSLRQNQLTDQLEQAALPSLLFNIFFAFSLGLYIYILYQHFNINRNIINWGYIAICVVAVSVCYLVKYFSLLFTGWLINYKNEAKIYIFSIFLLNKIIGMLLLPFTIIIAFSTNKIADYAATTSIIVLAVLILTRFFRAYGLLQNKLKLNGIHFIIYIFSLEVLPILVIYKTVIVYFGYNS